MADSQHPWRSGGGSSSRPWRNTHRAAPAPAKHDDGGGGFFGALKRIPGDVGRDVYHAAVGSPAGLYYAGEAVAEDVKDVLGSLQTGGRGKPRGVKHPFKRTAEVGGAMAKSTIEDFQHPLRHPGYTALDVLGVASLGAGTAARGAAGLSKLRAGEGIGRAAEAAARRPVAPPRVFKVGNLEVEHPSSRAALTRGVQKLSDKRLHAKAEKNPTGRAAKRLQTKAGKALMEELRVDEALGKADAAALHAVGRKLNKGEQYALRVVAEEAPLNKRIAATKEAIGNTRGAERRRHATRLTLLEQARKHIVDADAKPEFRPEATKLKAVYGRMQKVAGSRERLAKELGLLSDEAIQARKTSAGRAAMGAKWTTPTIEEIRRIDKIERRRDELRGKMREAEPTPEEAFGMTGPARKVEFGTVKEVEQKPGRTVPGEVTPEARAELDRLAKEEQSLATAVRVNKPKLVGHESFEASPESVYVPDIEQKVGRSGRVPSVGGQGTIGHYRSPIRQGYTGAQKRQAREPLKTTRAVAEAKVAVSRFARLAALRGKLVKASAPAPRMKDDIAIRLDKMGQHERLPKDVRQFLDEPEELANLTPDEQFGKFEALRSSLIVGDDKTIRQMSGEQLAEFTKLQEQGKIGWVPKRLLGDLAKAHAPLSASFGKTPVQVIDSINNAQRLAVLYLKPAYAVPNLLGNAALNLIQQGFAMPRNLAFASRMQWKLGPELTTKVDTLMHEGFAAALRGEQGAGARATQGLANVWGKGVDRPFRRASFIHEARRSGFKSPERLERLLTDPMLHKTLIDVTKRANRQIIDYGRLSHKEREIVRRVVFFYPWVKGSTVYAGNLLMEYPAKSAAIGALGQEGIEESNRRLGERPSYLEGAIGTPWGMSNPSAAAILQTPAQVGAAAAGLATGRVPQVAELSEFPTPALQFASALYSGRNARTGREYARNERGIPRIAFDTLVASTPQYRLQEQVRGTSKARLFTPSPRSGLMQFLVGGVYPRQYDPSRLRALARREQKELAGR